MPRRVKTNQVPVLKVQHSTVERDQPGANAPDEPENHDGNSVDTDGTGAFTPVPNGTSSTVEASVDADDEELTVPNGTSSTDEDERVVDPLARMERRAGRRRHHRDRRPSQRQGPRPADQLRGAAERGRIHPALLRLRIADIS